MKKQKTTFLSWLVLILVPIITWGFYWYVGFNQVLVKLILFITAVLLLFVNLKSLIRSLSKKNSYDKIVTILVILILLSIITTYFYWGQNPFLTFRAAASEFCVLYYFLLKKSKIDSRKLTYLVTFFSGVYVLLWFVALKAAPIVLFGDLDEIGNDRGFYRILQLNGIDTLGIFFFLCLVNFCESRRGKLVWLVAALVSYVIIFLSLSRNLIFCISFASFLYLCRYGKKKLICAVIVMVIGGGYYIGENEIVKELSEMTQEQVEDKSESNLRIVEYTMFTKLFPSHIGTVLFGNGEPHVNSSYGRREESLKYKYNFNRSDAGYVHILTSYGIVMLGVLLYLFVKVIKQNVSMQIRCYKLFIIMLFLMNIMTSSFFSYMVAFAISIYAMELDRESHIQQHDV